MDNEQSPAVRKANQHFRKEAQARENQAAWKEYNAQEDAARQKTAKLRAQRLARDASPAADDGEATPKVKSRAKAASQPKSK